MKVKGLPTQPKSKRFSPNENQPKDFKADLQDPRGLALAKKQFQTKEDALEPYRKVAEGMETQFVHHMIKQMRNTVPQDKPDSGEVNYYKSLMDYERAKIMATDPKGGIGIKKLVLDEITPAYLKENHRRPQGNYQAYKNTLKENTHE